MNFAGCHSDSKEPRLLSKEPWTTYCNPSPLQDHNYNQYDIAVLSQEWEQHLEHLAEVLHCLRTARLTAKLVKCSFTKSHVEFLCHVAGGRTVKPQAAKIEAIRNFKCPKTKIKDIRPFLGLAGYYRKFIPNFSDLTSGLNKKGVPNPIPWTEEHQSSIDI